MGKNEPIPRGLKNELHKEINASTLSDAEKSKFHETLEKLEKMQQFKSLVADLQQREDEIEDPPTEEEVLEGSPREQAERITKGEDEPHHIGRKTREVFEQEITSLKQTNPAFRNRKWHRQFKKVHDELLEYVQRNPRLAKQNSDLMQKLQSVRNSIEL